MAFENLLIEYGIIRFGRFSDGKGGWMPFKLNLEWMVSYPDVLKTAAFDVQNHFRVHNESINQFERILCPIDALPVATLVSANTGIPVVYSRGQGTAATHDLVGAHDINHPTLLITTTHVSAHSGLSDWVEGANQVGLKVCYHLSLVEGFTASGLGIATGNLTSISSLARLAAHGGLITHPHYEQIVALNGAALSGGRV